MMLMLMLMVVLMRVVRMVMLSVVSLITDTNWTAEVRMLHTCTPGEEHYAGSTTI